MKKKLKQNSLKSSQNSTEREIQSITSKDEAGQPQKEAAINTGGGPLLKRLEKKNKDKININEEKTTKKKLAKSTLAKSKSSLENKSQGNKSVTFLPNSTESKESKANQKDVLEKYVQFFSAKKADQKVMVEINTQQNAMKEEMEKLKKKIKDAEDEVKEGENKKDINELKDKIFNLEKYLEEHVQNNLIQVNEENNLLEKENKNLEKKLFTLRETLKNEEEEYNILMKNFDDACLNLEEEIMNAKNFEGMLLNKVNEEEGDLSHVISQICKDEVSNL